MAKKDPERRAATRQRIVDAYVGLYKARPSKAVTASAVIEKAGVNRSTFYEYFVSVQDLQRAIEDDLITAMEKTAESAIVSSGDFDIVGLVSQTYAMHGDLIGLLIGENGSASFVARAKRTLAPLVLRALESCVSLEDAPYVAEFVTSGLVSLYALWFKNGEDILVERLAPLARSLVFSCLDRGGE